MIISFDIDNTLIPYSDEFEVVELAFWQKLLAIEPIRKGTIDLFQMLEKQGHEIWIYTTSFRSIFSLRKTFISYGLSPAKIINEKINQRVLKKHQCPASKNARLFGIDIHIDDLEGVRLEGMKYGFEVIVVTMTDKNWTHSILNRVNLLQQQH